MCLITRQEHHMLYDLALSHAAHARIHPCVCALIISVPCLCTHKNLCSQHHTYNSPNIVTAAQQVSMPRTSQTARVLAHEPPVATNVNAKSHGLGVTHTATATSAVTCTLPLNACTCMHVHQRHHYDSTFQKVGRCRQEVLPLPGAKSMDTSHTRGFSLAAIASLYGLRSHCSQSSHCTNRSADGVHAHAALGKQQACQVMARTWIRSFDP